MLSQKVEESYDTRLLVVPRIFMHLCESRSCRNTQDSYDMQKCVRGIFEMRVLTVKRESYDLRIYACPKMVRTSERTVIKYIVRHTNFLIR